MMESDATQILPISTWSDPRVHLLDDTWLLTIFAVLMATAVPWLLSGFDIDFIAASLGLLALGAIHIALTVLGRRIQVGKQRTLLMTLHMTGVLIVGFVWVNVGGLQNPAFLMVFVLPVVGAIFLSRWQPYLMAVLSVVVAGAVALAQAPELRWYAPGLNTAGVWLATVLGQQGAISAPFKGFYAPSGYFVVLLQIFSILLFACAVAAEYLGTIFERLHSHVDVARAEAERGQEFWTTLIEELPQPALLVDADTLRIVCVSKRVAEFSMHEAVNGRPLFDTIRFSYPEVIQELITAAGGVVPLGMVQIEDRLRAAEVRVQHVSHKGRRFALMTLEDKTDDLTVKAALDLTGQAALVIDSQGRVLIFNKPAVTLFPGVAKDASAAQLLSVSGMPQRWWEPDLSGRRRMHVEIAPHMYQVTSSALPLPGEEDRLFVVTLLPVARAAVGDRTALSATGHFTALTGTTGTNRKLATPP